MDTIEITDVRHPDFKNYWYKVWGAAYANVGYPRAIHLLGYSGYFADNWNHDPKVVKRLLQFAGPHGKTIARAIEAANGLD